ncbi:HigA family addiction module antitoxin [Xanthomonas hortorum pv. vitians]|uniref:HigA family addiction module antitoxin n=1 Tax=Xanthomonas hortorum pv. vitians TaxID=83224 RepID=A0A6V7E8T8_9XANT|nr:HigA family addiction module antitoxin [Xanthomonas hortorum]APP84977.1 addiction module antidote protein, HigA family [Xanthomonas hortorum pv. gardneri]ASW45070.1 addiction module antidote protein, HigA family [Xanthomonas hortorum]MCC8494569.1 HigA family addiction module antitoxin [Xanthomonas hortorum pv. gardneri]MCC8555015.1 HigA family addiction module antitoxin [Xanthomonas hortorum pv. gardneri]MCE4291449.1 HigA family addiction module antitoxin [Xanthomonas hortorum pv. vitians]
MRPNNKLRAIHPGEILREDFMLPLGLTINGLARALDVPATRIHSIVHGERAISADTAARLARHFGGDAASWLALQATYELKTLPNRSEIERNVQPRVAA